MGLFKRRLRAARSPLIASSEATGQLMRQAESVLDDVEDALRGARLTLPNARGLSWEIGVSRAVHGVHPLESLRAATAMFEVLLPVVHHELRTRGASEQAFLDASDALHKSIINRIGLGALSYANFLRNKVYGAHRDERRRIARELHDRAAHPVGVALQNLDLHDVFADSDPRRARNRVGKARTALLEALDVVRELAEELRESAVELGGLEKALAQYLDSYVRTQVEVLLSVTGEEHLPDEVCEELYFVLREAIRNAVLHARATTLDVRVEVDDREIRASVHDDGVGFDVAASRSSAKGIGLSSARERVELLGGTLTIDSRLGRGATISIRIARPELNS